ncbi:SPL family radical SAM protein [Pseudoneobacillus sp. C159]
MKTEFFYKSPKSLLNKGTGYLEGYTHSLNPYSGCSFACSYCYVRRMPVALFRGNEWGTWVDVKNGAAELLEKELKRVKAKGKVTIFMSSSTDPYQPIESKEEITRSILKVIVDNPPDFLLVQTRSPLVSRDIDLLLALGNQVRVSMTIETDREDIRKEFTPAAPPVQARLKTLQLLKEAGVPTQATIAPILPSSEDFPEMLAELVNRVCIDDYFMGDGSGGKRTKTLGVESIYKRLGAVDWYSADAYRIVEERLRKQFADDQIYISQTGFLP